MEKASPGDHPNEYFSASCTTRLPPTPARLLTTPKVGVPTVAPGAANTGELVALK